MIAVLATALAFWLGYSVNQSGTCLVSAAHEVVHHRRARRVVGLTVASLAAGLVTVPLAWSPVGTMLAGSTGISLALLSGAVAFGLGALINDACLLGSLGRLGNGESRLLALPLGLATGFLLTLGLYRPNFEVQPSVLSSPSPVNLLVLASFLLALVVLIAFLRRSAQKAMGARTAAMSMVVLGLSGGALYALMPAWAYTDLLLAHLPFGLGKTKDVALATVLAAIAGAIFSAYRKRTWRPRGASLRQLGKTFTGGVLMGTGAALIPGGNDSLILAAIPALSSSGIIAYLVMFLVISLAMMLARPKSASHLGVG
ncbi:YeeE/YedE family protein [Xanthomonas sp. AmX2]|nr:YeeE/YedE family protein [Xanthomonas sp.]